MRLLVLLLFLGCVSLFSPVFAPVVTPAVAEDRAARLDRLFTALAARDVPGWEQIEAEIRDTWAETGSPTLDLLLERGREALAAGDTRAAQEHLTALVENAPGFAEGYNARATARFEAGLIGPAMADIARALALEPRHFAALAGLGVILEDTGDPRGALRAYRAARAIHPHRPDLREAVERLEAVLRGEEI